MIKKLFANTFHYTVINLSGAVISFALNFILVAEYGDSKNLEVYLIIFNLFLVLITLLRNILSTVFVPKYLEMKSLGQDKLTEFTNQILGVVLLIGGFLAVAFCVFDDSIYRMIAPGSFSYISSEDKIIFQVFSLYLFFVLSYSYFSIISITNGQVLLGTVYVLFQNVSPLIFFFIYRSIYSIVLSHVIISGFLFLFYLLKTNRTTSIRFLKLFHRSEEKNIFLRSTAPVFFSNVFIKIISVYEKSIASTFSLGTVVVLDFSYKLISRFVGIVSSGASISSYPIIVESILEEDDRKLNRIIYFSMTTMLLVSCSILSVLIVLNTDMIEYIFSIGKMSDISGRLYKPMIIYSVAFIFLNTNDLLRKICFSYGFIKFISFLNILQVIVNVALILVLKLYIKELSIPLSLLVVLFLYHFVLIYKIKSKNPAVRIYFQNKRRINILLLIFIQLILSLLISRISLTSSLTTLFLRALLIGLYFIFIYGRMFKNVRNAIKEEKE
jgi:putative peptidoglycan lipid II flippase